MFRLKLHWWIFIALGAGVIAGWISNRTGGGGEVVLYGFLGELFLRALKLIIVPLIFSSIVTGIAGLGEVRGFGRLGLKTLGYYVMTSLISILIGLTLVNLIEPGLTNGEPNPRITALMEQERGEFEAAAEDRTGFVAEEGLGGVLRGLFLSMVPVNFVAAASDNGQLLSLIFVSLLTAFGIIRMQPHGKDQLLGFFRGLNSLMLTVTGWIMLCAPIGVFGLVAETVAATGFELLAELPKYFVTVLLALFIHLFVALPLILALVAKVNPLRHFTAMRQALVTAFSTASSSGTLPVTMRCVQENAGVSKRVTSFVLPLGATVNMDGTALYECVAVMFIAQLLGYQLDFAMQFTIVALALLTSIGVAGVPSASLVAIVLIIQNVGIAGAGAAIGLIYAVDRLLDMTRTAVNIFSDSCGAVVIAKSEGEDVLTAPSAAPRPSPEPPAGSL